MNPLILSRKLNWTVWIGLSIPIDFLILAVPLSILSRTRMPERERKILRLIFSANLLGTVTWYANIVDLTCNADFLLVHWEYTVCMRIE
jgi:hypothetical protein